VPTARETRGHGAFRAFAHPTTLNPSYDVRYFVAFSRNFTSADLSSAEPIVCSGILVPGV